MFQGITQVSDTHVRSNTLPLVDVRNRYRTRSLFFETYNSDRLDPDIYYPIWTLKDRDFEIKPINTIYRPDRNNKLPSLRNIYLSYDDPTEYTFAEKVFGSWEHWQVVSRTADIKDEVERWRNEMKVRIESEAFRAARAIASTGEGMLALQAAKWLHQAVQPKNTKGRPSKKDVEAEAKKLVREKVDQVEDRARIGIEIVETLSDHEKAILEDI